MQVSWSLLGGVLGSWGVRIPLRFPLRIHLKTFENLSKKLQKNTPKTSKIHPQHGSNLKSNMKPKFGGVWERLGVSLERLGGVLGRLWGRLGDVSGAVSGAGSALSWGSRWIRKMFNGFGRCSNDSEYPQRIRKDIQRIRKILKGFGRCSKDSEDVPACRPTPNGSARSASRHPPTSIEMKIARTSPFQTYPLITSLL